MEKILTFSIENELSGKTVKYFLKQKLKLSARQIILLKQRERGILQNGQRVFVSSVLNEGDKLSLLLEEEGEGSFNILPTPGNLSIVYEDEDILILNKPPHLVVHPTKGHYRDTLANIVMWHYKKQGINFTFRCVNRLDDTTSGLMMIAKNAYVHEKMMREMHTGSFIREYRAIVKNDAICDEGTISLPIAKEREDGKRRHVNENGKSATTFYKVLKRGYGKALLRLVLGSGRTHQIRVHLSYIGAPILGDTLYGEESFEIQRPALHSAVLEFIHPFTGERLSFCAPYPKDMEEIIQKM